MIDDTRLTAMDDAEANAVRELGNRIGFGNVMHRSEIEWAKALASRGDPSGGEHTTGPCAIFMVRCDHNGGSQVGCDWCCGCGRVTKRVAQAMAEARDKR